MNLAKEPKCFIVVRVHVAAIKFLRSGQRDLLSNLRYNLWMEVGRLEGL
jgi:hypothetical protein